MTKFSLLISDYNLIGCWGSSIYYVVSQGGGGVDEMTMNDHEGEGRAIKMTMWSLGLKCILRQIKKYLREFSIWTVA